MYIRLKELREKNKLSIKQLADYLKVSASFYEAIESGKKEVSIQILSQLARKYHTSIDYLIGDTDTCIPHEKINS